MSQDIFQEQLDLIEESKIMLLIGHEQNKTILENYLQEDFRILHPDKNLNSLSPDIILFDNQGLQQYEDQLLQFKKSRIALYLPMILITSTSINNIPEKYLKIIDEIVQTPIQKQILYSRIQNLLNIRKLFLSTHIYQKLTEKNPVGICILQDSNQIKYVNNAFLKIIGKNKNQVLGDNIEKIFPGKNFIEYLEENSESVETKINLEIEAEGGKKWIDVRFSTLKYESINLKLLIVVDITRQKQSQEKIRYLSFHDQLTELYNRDYFMEELHRLNTSRQLPLTIIMGDINNLKLVNDAFGHNQGDQLLKKVAEILKNNIREADILARVGGDEFAILLPRTKLETAREIISRIKKSCSHKYINRVQVSIALGAATKENCEEDIFEIYKKADGDMYQHKTVESDRVKNNIIEALESSLEEESCETSQHTQSIKKLALRFGRKIGLNEQQLKKLELLSRHHDIGKVSVSKNILKKPEELSGTEFEEVKQHSECGFRIAQSVPFLTLIAEEILTHHERWDGKGYPQGLEGEKIPLLSRIMAIIDSYTVMRQGRPYQKAKSKGKALQEVKRQAGKQFDPALARKFVEMISDS